MKRSELKALIREVVEAAMHKSPSGKMTNMSPSDDDYQINYGKQPAEYVYVDGKNQVTQLGNNFVQDYIEGVEDGTYDGAVYKKVTK